MICSSSKLKEYSKIEETYTEKMISQIILIPVRCNTNLTFKINFLDEGKRFQREREKGR